jgi:hypothetical protein
VNPSQLIQSWLAARLSPSASAWVGEKTALFAAGGPARSLFPAFSAAVRQSGKAPLALDAADLASARKAVEGWNPSDWTLDEAVRIRLLLALPDGQESAALMHQMYETADVGEAVALLKALPLLPSPELHMPRAREAIRSNVKLQFDAVALRNPYAALHVDETGWNQLVTKTFFVDSPLEEVWGLDRRVNPALGRILADLAFERWAAGRTFGPMLWRCVGPVAEARGLEALRKALTDGDAVHRRAAALALSACKDPEAARILQATPAAAAAIAAAKSGALTWENLHAFAA